MEGFFIPILLLNFAGINTISEVRNLADADSVTHFVHRHLPTYALFHLATHLEYVQPKSAMGKLRKVDSFFRESQQLSARNGACNCSLFLSIAIFSHRLL